MLTLENSVENTAKNAPTAAAIIAIGVSSGGLEALTEILAPLPADFPATILIAMHGSQEVLPDGDERLAERLRGRTALTVRQARSGDRITAGTVFVAPPDYHLIVTALGVVWLSVEPKVNAERPAADPLFKSVAAVYGERAIGVVLTGNDGDGVAGIRAIKSSGGRTIAQSEATSKNPSMPRSAITTGRVDLVLPLGEIAQTLREFVGR